MEYRNNPHSKFKNIYLERTNQIDYKDQTDEINKTFLAFLAF